MPVIGSGRSILRWCRHPLAAVLALAALVRLLFFLETRGEATFAVPLWDAAVFDEMARSVARGDGVGYPKAYFFGPLYAYVLGFFYWVTGNSATWAIVVQQLLGVSLAGLTYGLCRTWFGRKESVIAAALLGFSGVQIFYEAKLLMEVWVSALLVGSVWILARLDRGPTDVASADTRKEPGRPARGNWLRCYGPSLFISGLLMGAAAVGRPTLLLLAPLGVVPLLRSRNPFGYRIAGMLFLVYLAGVGIAPGATLVRNFRAEGVWVPITSSGGFNLYLGTTPSAAGGQTSARARVDSSWNGEDTAEAEVGRQLDSAEVSRYWLSRALEEVAAAPAGAAGHYLGKLQSFFNGQDIPQIEHFSFEAKRYWVLRFSIGLHFLMACAVAGIVVRGREVRRLVLLYGPLLLYAGGVSLFFMTTRYRVVALPYVSIFAAVFLTTAYHSIRARAWKPVGWIALLALGAWGFTHPSFVPVDRTKSLYAQQLHDGFRLTRAGQFEGAISAYLEAQRLQPDDYEAYLSLGITYREQGDLQKSIRQLDEAMRRNRVDAEVPYHFAITLHKMRRHTEAEAALRQSLRMNPRRALTHTYLGLTLAAQGRLEDAQDAFDQSLALDPMEAFTHNNLGVLFGMRGDHVAARASFLRAVEADPSYAPARRNLAQSYLEAGDPAAAVRELRRVLADDPGDQSAAELLRSIPGGTTSP